MQERSEAERCAIWPCLNVATWRRERSDRAIQQILSNSTALHSIPALRSEGSTSVLSTRKIRPIYSHPWKGIKHTCILAERNTYAMAIIKHKLCSILCFFIEFEIPNKANILFISVVRLVEIILDNNYKQKFKSVGI